MKKKINLNKLLYLLFIISWGIGDLKNNINDDIKYVFFFVHLLFLILLLIKRKFKNKKNIVEFKELLLFIVPLACYSLILQCLKATFLTQTIKDFLYIFCPILYVYLLVNSEKDNDYSFYFKSELIVASIVFIIRAIPLFSTGNIMSISFSNSYSPFEGVGNADIFLIMFLYFYLRKEKRLAAISIILLFLSFKRIHLTFAIIFPIIDYLLKKKGITKVNNIVYIITILFFLLSPVIIGILVNDNFSNWFYAKTSMSLNDFTMGRLYTINFISDYQYTNLGLGTISDLLQKLRLSNPWLADDLHCDLMRIFLEGTFISLILLVCNYFKITKKNIYNFLLMVFIFVTMFSSHLLTTFIFWIFALLFIFENNNKEEYRK